MEPLLIHDCAFSYWKMLLMVIYDVIYLPMIYYGYGHILRLVLQKCKCHGCDSVGSRVFTWIILMGFLPVGCEPGK